MITKQEYLEMVDKELNKGMDDLSSSPLPLILACVAAEILCHPEKVSKELQDATKERLLLIEQEGVTEE